MVSWIEKLSTQIQPDPNAQNQSKLTRPTKPNSRRWVGGFDAQLHTPNCHKLMNQPTNLPPIDNQCPHQLASHP